jgi:NAD(P)-dependent dehydrogenase (short-subunit alcohol dehydrogenase family)
MEKRIAIVTGATGAIGKAIAAGLAGRPGWGIVLLGRNEAKLEHVAKEIRRKNGNAEVRVALADLGENAQIEAFVEAWQGPLHVLINNAAIAPRRREETADGVERQFAVNVLSYLRLARGLRGALARAEDARVVNVASYWAGGLDIDDIEFKRRPYDNDAAYRQSKQANRMLSAALAERFQEDGIAVNACHPGDVASQLSSDLGFGGHESPEQGAATPVWLATDPALAGRTGAYFEHQREKRCDFCGDRQAVARLYQICMDY